MLKKWIDHWWGRLPPIRKRNEAQAAEELRQREIERLNAEAEQAERAEQEAAEELRQREIEHLDAEAEQAEQEDHDKIVGRLAEWKEQTEQAQWICSRCKKSATKADWIYLRNYNLWQCRTDTCGNLKRDASGPALIRRDNPDAPDAPRNPYSR